MAALLSSSEQRYVDERADGFYGRRWVLDRVDGFLSGPSGIFVVVGDPGTGKTALAAYLAGAQLNIVAAVFCRTGQLGLLEIAQRLSDQLAAGVPGFGDALKSTLSTQISIGDIKVVTGDVAPGAAVVGLKVRLDALAEEQAFDLGVAVPLRRLREQNREGQLVILVDALDEGPAVLSRYLAELEGVHLVVTTRRDDRVLAQLPEGAVLCDLVDAPDDVFAYSAARLAAIGTDVATRELARRISTAAGGNFLYAVHVINTILAIDAPVTTLAGARAVQLPAGGLPGVYRDFLRRELAGQDEIWARSLRPVLAPLCVARGDGLTTPALSSIAGVLAGTSVSRTAVRDAVRRAGQFIDGPRPDGPFRLYHQSFAEFLVDPKANPDWFVDGREADAAVVEGLTPRSANGAVEWEAADEYACAHLAAHAAAAGRLDDLLADPGFVVAAQPTDLLRSLTAARRPSSHAIARVYLQAADGLRAGSEPERASHLELVARQNGESALADAIAARHPQRPWSARWAHWRTSDHLVAGRHAGPVYTIAVLSCEGGLAAVSGGEDATVRVWDLEAGGPIGDPFFGHRERVNALDVCHCADGSQIVVSGSSDRTVRVWDSETGAQLCEPLRGHETSVYAVAVVELSDGRRLAAAGAADGSVRRWDISDFDGVKPVGEPLVGHEKGVHELIVARRSADGRPLLISVSHDRALVWYVDDGAQAGSLPGDAAYAVMDRSARLANGDEIAFVSARVRGWTAGLFDVAEGESPTPIGRGMSSPALAAVRVGQRNVAVQSDDLGRLALFDASDGTLLGAPLVGHAGTIFSVATGRGADGRDLIVSAGQDGTVRVWDLLDGTRGDADTEHVAIKAAATGTLPDGTKIAVTGGSDSRLRTWNLRDGAPLAVSDSLGQFRSIRGTHPVSVSAIGLIDDGDGVIQAVTGDELGYLRVWSLPKCQQVGEPTKAHVFWITGLALARRVSDGALLAACCGDSAAPRIWDVAARQLVAELKGGGSETGDWADVVVAVPSSAETPLVATGGFDGRLRLWDLSGASVSQPTDGPGGRVTAMTIDPTDRIVLGTREGRLLSLALDGNREPEPASAAHASQVTSLASGFAASAPVVVSGSEDQTVRILDLRTDELFIVRVGAAVSAVAVATSGIVIGSDAGLMLVEYRVPSL